MTLTNPWLAIPLADYEAHMALPLDPVDLVYAALLFEYVDAGRVLENIRGWLRGDGELVAVLQMPSAQPEVTPSPFTSLAMLAPAMRLVSPQDLAALAIARGYTLVSTQIASAGGGKRFAVQTFRIES